jgi:hypothetical protein
MKHIDRSSVKAFGGLAIACGGTAAMACVIMLYLLDMLVATEHYAGSATVQDLWHEPEGVDTLVIYGTANRTSSTVLVYYHEKWSVLASQGSDTWHACVSESDWHQMKQGCTVHIYEKRGWMLKHGARATVRRE